MKYNLYLIYTILKMIILKPNNKNNLNVKLAHELDDKINLNDIKRLKSSAFNDENYTIL